MAPEAITQLRTAQGKGLFRVHYSSNAVATALACCYSVFRMAPKKKLTIEEAAEKLAAIAEKHLSVLPDEEQEAKVAAFKRVDFTASRASRSRSSESSRKPRYRVAGRDH